MPSTLYRIPFDLFVKVKAQSGFEVIRWNSRTLLVISGFPGINGFVSLVRHKIHSIKKWKKTCYKGLDNIGFSLFFFQYLSYIRGSDYLHLNNALEEVEKAFQSLTN